MTRILNLLSALYKRDNPRVLLFVYFFPTKRTKIKMYNICTRTLKLLWLDINQNGWVFSWGGEDSRPDSLPVQDLQLSGGREIKSR